MSAAEQQDLIPLADPQPAALFVPGGLDDLLARIETDARALVQDVSTAKGRKAIASTAARVARSKTYLDGMGKDFVAGLKAQTKAVDAERRAMRERLDALKAEVRKPLTEFEQAEADRQAAIRERIQAIRAEQEAAHIQDPATASIAEIDASIKRVESIMVDESFEELQAEAQQTKDATLYRLNQVLTRVKASVEKEAEVEAERKAKEEAERKEREGRIAREAAEKAQRETEERAQAEAKRVEQERQAEAQRQERERREAIEAQQAAERRALEAEQRQQREAADAERHAQQQADEAARQERERIEAEQRAEKQKAERRAADREHRASVNREALAALVGLGLSDEHGRAVVAAVAKGQVPHITINY